MTAVLTGHTKMLHSFDSLIQCTTSEALHSHLKDAAHHLGFEHYLCGLTTNLNRPSPSVFALNGASPEWWHRYQSKSYLAIDPTVRLLLREQRSIPLPWWEINCADDAETQFMEEAQDHGLATGISFPMHARGEIGIFSLVLTRQQKQTKRHIFQTTAMGHLLASYVQEAARKLMKDDESAPAIKLTQRESECLLWAASGKTAWETSKILNISERTVIFHISNAASKLGVSNRQQAIARAIVQGLIHP